MLWNKTEQQQPFCKQSFSYTDKFCWKTSHTKVQHSKLHCYDHDWSCRIFNCFPLQGFRSPSPSFFYSTLISWIFSAQQCCDCIKYVYCFMQNCDCTKRISCEFLISYLKESKKFIKIDEDGWPTVEWVQTTDEMLPTSINHHNLIHSQMPILDVRHTGKQVVAVKKTLRTTVTHFNNSGLKFLFLHSENIFFFCQHMF